MTSGDPTLQPAAEPNSRSGTFGRAKAQPAVLGADSSPQPGETVRQRWPKEAQDLRGPMDVTVILEVTPELRADEKSGRTSGKTHEPCTSRQPDSAAGKQGQKVEGYNDKGGREQKATPLNWSFAWPQTHDTIPSMLSRRHHTFQGASHVLSPIF